jgi:large subunit ribosomal protein L25
MAVVELKGDFRQRTGKGGSRSVRREGWVPAILYGGDAEPAAIKVERGRFEALVRTPGGVHSVIDFKIPDQGEQIALIREIQRDPVSREVLHVDFQRIKAGELVHVVVPLVLTGLPVGVKLGGGVLEFVTREIDVRCLPRDIPGRWELDVSNLDVGDSVLVSDIELPNMERLTEGRRVVAVVVSPTKMTETTDAEDEAAAAEAAEGVKVEGDEKKDD